jgi:hypothetical protein
MQQLAERLTALGYRGLFLRGAADALWREHGMPAALAALAADVTQPAEARFLAAELVAERSGSLPPVALESLAAAYAAALRATSLANAWGLPGAVDTPPARHLVGLGPAALAALRPLLGDDRAIDYAGSEEATLAAQAGWRVKDLAAAFTAAIGGLPFDAGAPKAARDAAISRMLAAP